MPKVRKRNWTETLDPAYYEAADYLSLLLPTETAQLAVVRLRNGPMVSRRAMDLLRASGVADLPPENPSVTRKLKDLRRGKLLSPVLCLRSDLHDGAAAHDGGRLPPHLRQLPARRRRRYSLPSRRATTTRRDTRWGGLRQT